MVREAHTLWSGGWDGEVRGMVRIRGMVRVGDGESGGWWGKGDGEVRGMVRVGMVRVGDGEVIHLPYAYAESPIRHVRLILS